MHNSMNRKFEVSVNEKLCKKCGICVALCPKGVFSLSDKLSVEAEKCNGCRRCEVYCPDFAIEVNAREEKHEERAVARE